MERLNKRKLLQLFICVFIFGTCARFGWEILTSELQGIWPVFWTIIVCFGGGTLLWLIDLLAKED